MPYKSQKQRRFFHAAEARGEISSAVVKEFDQASKGISLVEAVNHKKKQENLRKKWRGGEA